MAEIPGITPKVADFARQVVAAGFTVVMPVLFGTPGAEVSPLNGLKVISGACVSKEFAAFAKSTLGCTYFNWLTAVDWKEQGLEVLARVEDLAAPLVVTMRTRLAPGATGCASLTSVFRGSGWMERECYDMFGVVFDGHPDLRRILLGDDWEGYPLRKDYAVDTPHAPYR
jgi:NADH:ubiquinone oxidoreductase subunit C